MEDGDDDFGDLYADVEVEASSAINGGPQFPQLQSAIDEMGKQKSVLEASSDKEDRASDGIDDYEDDDDDDDLDIVLNSDDDSNRHGEGFTIGRNNTNLRNGELEDEDDEEEFVGGKVVCKPVAGGDGVNQSLIGGKGVYNSNSMYKYLRSHSAIYASDFKGSGFGASTYLTREDNGYCQRMASRSMGPQSAQRFSLPRARNILDVNIDIFEQKPWKLPGADITDYFNFGFNEESWKLYCNQVDEYRHRGYMSSGTSPSEPAQMEAKAYENGLQHEIDACDTWGKGEIGQGKGRAIVVEGSNVERPSSMDVRRQMDRDSDVIEITILDRGDHCSGSAKEGLSHLNSSVPEASNHGDVSGDDGTDHLSFSSASDDESVEGNHMEMEIYALDRSSNLRSSSEPVTRGPEDHEIHQITDVYGHQRTRIDICGSGGTDEAIRTSDDTMEKSPAHHCKDLEDDTCIYRTKSYRRERRPSMTSFTELTRSVKPDYLHSEDLKRSNYKREHGENRYHVYDKKNHGDSKRKRHDESDDCYSRRLSNKRKSGDYRYHERCNGPLYNSRTRMDSKPKLHHENGDFCSRRLDDTRKPGERGHSNPVYNRRACGVPKLKAHHANDDLFPMSDIEGTYDVRSPLHHNRRNERWHLFDPYDEGNISYSKELELPSDYDGERFSGYEDWDSLAGGLRHEGYERFGAKMDLSVFRSSEEEEYYDERRRYMEDDKMMARDWCHYERELDVENVNFFSSQEFGWQNSKYPPYLKYRKGAPWRRKGDNMHLRNEGEDDECFLEQEYSDDIQGEKFRYLTYDDRERDAFESGYVKHVAYTRWEFRGPGKNKRRAGSPSSELNIPSLKRDEDSDPKYKEGRSFASRSSEESYINNDRWLGNMTPRKNLYGRHRRAQWAGRSRYDGSLGGYSEPFDREGYTIDINDRVDVGRRRHHWQSGMQCEADEIMLRHDDANFHAERAPCSFEKVSRRKSSVSEHVPDRVDELVDVPYVERRIYKQGERTSIDKFERTSNVTCEGSPKQRFERSRDSPYLHLVDGYHTAEELFDDVPLVGHKYEQTIEVKRGDKFDGTSNLTHGRSHEWLFRDRVDSLNSRLVDGSGHVEELIDDSHAEVCRYKETKELISGNKCSKTYGKSCEQPSLSCRNSHLVVRKGKSSKQLDRNINDQKKHTRIDPDSCPTDNVALVIKTNMADGGSDLEEGQILTREPNTGTVKDDMGPHDTKELHNQNKKTELDDSRILEAMAKMEKRKARFQEPVTIRSDSDGASASAIKPATVDSGQEPAATKQQRPARKRRWGGS